MVLLLLALIFDSIFDFDDGPFSFTGIGSFLGAFGFSGWIAISSGSSVGLAAIIGGGVGVLCWVFAYLIVKFLRGEEPDSISVNSYVGMTGVLSTAIREIGVGEVILNVRGEQITLAAYSTEPIAAQAEVEVTGVRGSGSVTVKQKEN
ncbi:MAG: NfeD family protein [Microbacteriaceae bacterium]